MRIVFVRHGEPNYTNDTLTEKGRREAELLSQRIKGWKVMSFTAHRWDAQGKRPPIRWKN